MRILFMFLILLLNGCITVPKPYTTQVWEEEKQIRNKTVKVLNVRQQGQGLVHAKINKEGDIDIITDYKSTPFLIDVAKTTTNLYAIKELGKE